MSIPPSNLSILGYQAKSKQDFAQGRTTRQTIPTVLTTGTPASNLTTNTFVLHNTGDAVQGISGTTYTVASRAMSATTAGLVSGWTSHAGSANLTVSAGSVNIYLLTSSGRIGKQSLIAGSSFSIPSGMLYAISNDTTSFTTHIKICSK